MPGRRWTDNETAVLRRIYADTPTRKIAERLGRTEKQVYTKAQALGLRKSAEYLTTPAAGRIRPGSNMGGHARFKKGNTPWNKGMDGYNPNNHGTRFKPGNRSGQALYNLKPVGAERVEDGYLVSKVADTGVKRDDWRFVHHIEWEKHHGAIPKGHIVVFRDGNKRNTDISNLELISRAENMRRNSLHRYPKELVSAIQLTGSLKRKIRERAEREKQN